MHAAALRQEKPVTVTVQRAQAITGLGHTTIYALVKEGRLKSTTVGNRRLIFFESIEALLAEEQ
jgi:excisionase family DNA binding protein